MGWWVRVFSFLGKFLVDFIAILYFIYFNYYYFLSIVIFVIIIVLIIMIFLIILIFKLIVKNFYFWIFWVIVYYYYYYCCYLIILYQINYFNLDYQIQRIRGYYYYCYYVVTNILIYLTFMIFRIGKNQNPSHCSIGSLTLPSCFLGLILLRY